ncbi:MAG TPA: TonB-dependent receptor [Gemmatimonadales bacterium]|nr:TonB-dependent receptor [Gemmatimonadales bacterium]
MRAPPLVAWLLLAGAAPLAAQTTGSISGHVREQATGAALRSAQVLVDGRLAGLTDSSGAYQVRAVRSGWHRVSVRLIGFATAARDSVPVRSGEITGLDFQLQSQAVQLGAVTVEAAPDAVLDPLATSTVQHISADDLRHLPVSTLEEAVALSAGAVGGSYRGGRLGEQAFIIDGLGLKNQLDASTGTLGLNIPPDVLTEASLVTNGFSARYGQALSGLINVVTRDGGDRWQGRAAYESDRGLGSALDHGLDRLVLEADGPLPGGIRLLGAVDATGRLDADPVNAPAPADPRDPRSANPNLLPHNSGEELDAAAKLTVPLAGRQTLRVFALHSLGQQLLFDQTYKYDLPFAPAQRVAGDLVSGHLQLVSPPTAATPVVADLRVGYFGREFERGTLAAPVSYRFGAFTGQAFHFVGEDLARARDTTAAAGAVPGFDRPDFSTNTPWGVPAFFMGGASDGTIAWNRFREVRGQLDVDVGLSHDADVYVGGELVRQRVETFQRVLAFLPVGDSVPPAAAAAFSPTSGAGYAEAQLRMQDLALTVGARYDAFDPHTTAVAGGRITARGSLNPRLAVSAVLHGATFVASWGRFSQAPDYQYMVDAAFADTARTGRFRVGNPDLGFEQSTQYEFSVRARPTPNTSLKVNLFVKQLTGLVASVPFGVNPDSTIFGNTDYGSVKGLELLWERELKDWWGLRVSYTLQYATATSTNGFELLRPVTVVGTDTIFPGRVEFPLDYDRRHGVVAIFQARSPEGFGPRLLGVRPLAALEGAAIFRFSTGLPYSLTNAAGDSLLGPPNAERLPSQSTLDVLLRRPVRLGPARGSVYLDVRNLLDTRNIIAVRRDTGTPGLGEAGIQAAALAAYTANPQAIPYESPRYRGWADTNHDGLIAGQGELLPLYVAAARDFYQPLFAYGPPRLVRLGVEFIF